MKKGLISGLTILVVLATVSLSTAEPVVLRFASFEPPHVTNNTKVIGPWIEKVNKDGAGVLKIDFFTSGALGRDPRAQLKLVTTGVADFAFIINSYTPGRFPDDDVVGAPLIARNNLESSVAFQRLFERGMLRGYDDLVLIGHHTATQYLIHSNYPIKVPADMKGKKFKATGKLQFDLVKACGGAPIGMSITKVAESINRGVIDGMTGEAASMDMFKCFEVVKYHCMVEFGTSNQMTAMSRKKYDSLPPAARAVLDKNRGMSYSRKYGEVLTEHNANLMKKYQAAPGHVWYTPTPDEMKQWKALMEPVVVTWAKNHPKGQELLDAYTEEVLKVRNEK